MAPAPDGGMTFIVVADDDTFREVTVGGFGADALQDCRTLVDGDLELLTTVVPVGGMPTKYRAMCLWVNDSASWRDEMTENHVATEFVLMGGQFGGEVHGPAVLAGSPNSYTDAHGPDEAMMVGLDGELLESVRRHLARLGAVERPAPTVKRAAAELGNAAARQARAQRAIAHMDL